MRSHDAFLDRLIDAYLDPPMHASGRHGPGRWDAGDADELESIERQLAAGMLQAANTRARAGTSTGRPPRIASGEVTTRRSEGAAVAKIEREARVGWLPRGAPDPGRRQTVASGNRGVATVQTGGQVMYTVLHPSMNTVLWRGPIGTIPAGATNQQREDTVRRLVANRSGQVLRPHGYNQPGPDLQPQPSRSPRQGRRRSGTTRR